MGKIAALLAEGKKSKKKAKKGSPAWRRSPEWQMVVKLGKRLFRNLKSAPSDLDDEFSGAIDAESWDEVPALCKDVGCSQHDNYWDGKERRWGVSVLDRQIGVVDVEDDDLDFDDPKVEAKHEKELNAWMDRIGWTAFARALDDCLEEFEDEMGWED